MAFSFSNLFLFPFFLRLASISISFCSQDNWNCIFGSYIQNVFEAKRSGGRGRGVLPFLMDFCCWKKNIFKRQMCAYFCELMLRSNIYFFPPSVYSYLLRREISGKGFVVFLKVVLSFRENFVCVKIQVLIFMGGCFWSMVFA